jgi:SAM-dependent methyltransferase
MQERHTNRSQYFKEQGECVQKFVLPYILKYSNNKEESAKCRVLEVGCGEGGNILPFLEAGYDCCGIELSEASYNCAVEFYADHPRKTKLQLIHNDVYHVTPQETNGKFDIVFLKDVIEHIPNQERFMNHLKQFLAPNAVVFFAFPPWRMPFGGHQQVSHSKWVSHFPYIHLIPIPILKLFGVSKRDIDFLIDIAKTGISINRFERILRTEKYSILQRTHWLINPNYEVKFGLKPRKLWRIGQLMHIKDFYTTAMYYLISLDGK